MVVRDIERDDIEYISKTLNCLPIAHVDHMKPEKLGHADRVDEIQVKNCPDLALTCTASYWRCMCNIFASAHGPEPVLLLMHGLHQLSLL